jgi:DNA-binding LytR/AlgR family response regulator
VEEKMLRIAVVEDCKEDAEALSLHIEKFAQSENIQIHTDFYKGGLDFWDTFKANYDIICMDIEMPHMDGIRTAEKVRSIDEEVPLIFITNMGKYAINGYSVSALGYLLKPVEYTVFANVLKKAVAIVNTKARAIAIKAEGSIKKLAVSDIVYAEVRNNTVFFYMNNKTVHQSRMTLTEVENLIGDGRTFVRCNSCYLVNLRYVSDVYDSVVTVGDEKLAISRHKKKTFIDALSDYFGQR